jgi:hypothetical protein
MKYATRSILFVTTAVTALGLVSCARSKGDPPMAATAAPVNQNVPAAVAGTPIPVKVVKTSAGFQLTRAGKPYFIKGAGGSASLPMLHDSGANSLRTWGADNLGPTLAQAQALGMTVTAGIWLGQKQQGFNYQDPAAVAAQFQTAKADVLRYRNAPALLMWGLGNEMEVGDEDDVPMWNAIEAIAKMAHQLDPNHPTMCVVAEIGGDKVAEMEKYCPDIDIIGINSYGGAPSLATRYLAMHPTKPYVLTEFGPPGVWELPKNAWGASPEPSSTAKAAIYRTDYAKAVANQPFCLGSYAFTWGNKQEATATWYGMLLPSGDKLGAVDTMTTLWTGHAPASLCPDIQDLSVSGPDRVAAGDTVHAALTATDPQHDPLTVHWVLQADPVANQTGGAAQGVPPTFPAAIVEGDDTHAVVKMPETGGAYRLFAYVHDGHDGAAVANVPLFVTSSASKTAQGAPSTLPLVLYGTGASANLPYTPSGYMGSTSAITMDVNSADNPHSGQTCLKATYGNTDGWGGVVWQSPANDWGTLPGGCNLTGAKNLTFWARGAQGGEVVSFQYGLIGPDKAFPDTGSGKLQVTLTPQWKQYTMSLAGQDLSRIKTGFCWVVAGQGHPVTFYLDDIQYQSQS